MDERSLLLSAVQSALNQGGFTQAEAAAVRDIIQQGNAETNALLLPHVGSGNSNISQFVKAAKTLLPASASATSPTTPQDDKKGRRARPASITTDKASLQSTNSHSGHSSNEHSHDRKNSVGSGAAPAAGAAASNSKGSSPQLPTVITVSSPPTTTNSSAQALADTKSPSRGEDTLSVTDGNGAISQITVTSPGSASGRRGPRVRLYSLEDDKSAGLRPKPLNLQVVAETNASDVAAKADQLLKVKRDRQLKRRSMPEKMRPLSEEAEDAIIMKAAGMAAQVAGQEDPRMLAAIASMSVGGLSRSGSDGSTASEDNAGSPSNAEAEGKAAATATAP